MSQMSWRRTTETSLSVSFETCLRRREDVLMGRRCYVLLRRRQDVPIRRRGDVPLRRLDDVPARRRWVFHLRYTCDAAGTYRETLLRRRHDDLFSGGIRLYDYTGYGSLLHCIFSPMSLFICQNIVEHFNLIRPTSMC